MATSLKKLIQQDVYRVVFLQLACVVGLSLIALPLSGLTSSYSVLAGGLAYGLPNLVLVWIAFRYVGAQQMVQFVIAFFLGEMMKLALSAILFLVIVKYLPVSLLSTLAGLIGAIVSFWFVCLLYFSRSAESKQHI